MVGETKDFMLDYPKEPNPHAIMLGGSGSGKTTTLRAFLIRAYLEYGLRFLVIDWNGESEEWAGKINATVWKAARHFKINPFLLRDASIADRAGSIAELFQFGANLTPLQSNLIRSIALETYKKGETPTLMDIWKEIEKTASDRNQTSQRREYAEWIDQRLVSLPGTI
jgi:type IV secretory pathway VirB4 component